MNIRQLLYFSAVAEENSFSGATVRLHLSRQTLSRSIGELEEEWGLALFKRNVVGLQLTGDGVFLYEHGCKLLEEWGGLEAAMRARAETAQPGTRVVVISGTQTIFLKRIEEYRKHQPRRPLSITLEEEAGCEKALIQGTADLITTTAPVTGEGICSRKVCEFPMYIAVSPENPLARKKKLYMKELEGQTLITLPEIYHIVREFMEACRKRQVPFQKIEYNVDFPYCCELVCQNKGIMPVAGYAIHQQERLGLLCIPLAEKGIKWELFVSWHKRDEEKQAVRGVLEGVFGVKP